MKANQLVAYRMMAVVAAVVGFFLHLYAARDLYGWYERFIGWAFLVVFLFEAIRFLAASNRSVPFRLLIAFQFYILFGASQFTQESLRLYSGVYVPPEWALTTAVTLAFASEILVLLSFHAGTRMGYRPRAFPWSLYPEISQSWIRFAVLYAFSAVVVWYYQVIRMGSIPADFRQVLTTVINPGLGVAILLYLGYVKAIPVAKIAGWCAVVAIAVMGLVQGMMVNMLLPIYIAVLVIWIFRERLPVRWIVAAGLLFVCLNPVKSIYRHIAWDTKDVEGIAGISDRLSLWGVAIDTFVHDPFSGERAVEQTSSRTSGLLPLAHSIHMVDTVIPNKYGEGFKIALYSFVPRFLWKTKPKSTLLYDRYAIEFGVVPESVTKTSTTAMLMATEGYWDFGTVGVLAYALIFGWTFGYLFGPKPDRSEIRLLAGIVYSSGMMQLLDALSSFLMSLYAFFVGTIIACWIIQRLSARRADTSQLPNTVAQPQWTSIVPR